MLKEIATQPDLFTLTADHYPAPVAPPLPAAPIPQPAPPPADATGDTLTTEIATLHDLLTAVAGTADLDLAQRITAYCKGADTLARLLRAQHGLAPTDPAAGLAALLDRLDSGSAEF